MGKIRFHPDERLQRRLCQAGRGAQAERRRDGGKADGAATQQALRSLQSSLGTGGRTCRIACGSYTGSGEHGEAHPNTLQFDFTPVYLVVGSDSYGLIGSSRFLRPLALGSDQSGNRQVVSWGEKSVSWYFPGAENGHVWQNNTKDYVYHYVAIGYDAK